MTEPPETPAQPAAPPVPLVPPLDIPLASILLPPRRKVVADERELAAAIESAEPGDDILLRGGTYRESGYHVTRSGRRGAPIVLRSAPGEWAILDGAGGRADRAILEISGDGDGDAIADGGAHWSIEQMELTDSTTPRGSERRPPVNLYGRGSALRHLVVHDTSHIGNWRQTGPNECHGLLVFNCGASNLEHSMYVTGDGDGGAKRITQCVMLNSFAFNLHAFHDRFPVRGLHVEGCVAAGAGALRTPPVSRDNFFFAVEEGSEERLRDLTLERTYQWTAEGRTDGVSFGEYGEPSGHEGLTLIDNVWQLGEPLDTTHFDSVTGRGGDIAVHPRLLPDGVHYERDPLEDGRGIVVVMNARAQARTVTVDLGRVGIAIGDPYGIWDAAAWERDPLVSGRSIGIATVPMDGTPRRPVGLDPPATTQPDFGVFIVRRMNAWVA